MYYEVEWTKEISMDKNLDFRMGCIEIIIGENTES